jgi:hypothetical protein
VITDSTPNRLHWRSKAVNHERRANRHPDQKSHHEDGAHELATSPDMQPYLRLIKAGLQDQDIAPHIEEIPNCRSKSVTSGGSPRL